MVANASGSYHPPLSTPAGVAHRSRKKVSAHVSPMVSSTFSPLLPAQEARSGGPCRPSYAGAAGVVVWGLCIALPPGERALGAAFGLGSRSRPWRRTAARQVLCIRPIMRVECRQPLWARPRSSGLPWSAADVLRARASARSACGFSGGSQMSRPWGVSCRAAGSRRRADRTATRRLSLGRTATAWLGLLLRQPADILCLAPP